MAPNYMAMPCTVLECLAVVGTTRCDAVLCRLWRNTGGSGPRLHWLNSGERVALASVPECIPPH